MWSQWCVLFACCVFVNARPQRIRFPDQPLRRQATDDGATFVVRGTPQRSSFSRAINPLVNTIPREPLTLADPDQFLNAWQFYYPPGPPPTLATQEDFDAAGSADLPAVSESPQINVNVAAEPLELKPSVTFVANSKIIPRIELRDPAVNVSADIASNANNSNVNADQQVATSNNAVNHVISEAPPNVAQVENTTIKVTQAPNVEDQKSFSGPPIKPRFEDGGWTPLEGLPQ